MKYNFGLDVIQMFIELLSYNTVQRPGGGAKKEGEKQD
jgi:hypothetical protein